MQAAKSHLIVEFLQFDSACFPINSASTQKILPAYCSCTVQGSRKLELGTISHRPPCKGLPDHLSRTDKQCYILTSAAEQLANAKIAKASKTLARKRADDLSIRSFKLSGDMTTSGISPFRTYPAVNPWCPELGSPPGQFRSALHNLHHEKARHSFICFNCHLSLGKLPAFSPFKIVQERPGKVTTHLSSTSGQ